MSALVDVGCFDVNSAALGWFQALLIISDCTACHTDWCWLVAQPGWQPGLLGSRMTGLVVNNNSLQLFEVEAHREHTEC